MNKTQLSCWILPLSMLLSSTAAIAQSISPVVIEADVVYGHKDGLALTMDVFRPEVEANRAAILFMVSGGWYSKWSPPEQMRHLFQPYLDEGYTMIAVRHGSSPRYTIPEAVLDVQRAVRFVRLNAARFDIEADRLGVMGMSAGGHLSLILGTTGDDGDSEAKEELGRVSSRVAAVVALVPPTDLRVAVWDAPESLPAYRGFPALNLPLDIAGRYSPLVNVTEDDAPSLVMMGGKDKLVPAKHGEWIDDAFQKKGVKHKLIIFPEAGHGLVTDATRDQIVGETLSWFDHYLNQGD
ncbi:alpha/beta hydrolase family protein [Bythopirellula polymerisocia]|uniref:Acetyl esterase n=1 Tax=Bythopirellula polymerisocia TaxID=2528003 RepID=A0A5C6CBN0_9BACT|nr:alpha/beta hydrolase [Bythopirellula polymerisocia]TWU20806.1 acetyl esterase [Bythopirellula polymerisocia]